MGTIRITLLAEDLGNEEVIGGLIHRVSEGLSLEVSLKPMRTRGGHGRVKTELKRFMEGVSRGEIPDSDLVVLATDGNCKGNWRRKEILESISTPKIPLVLAVPDPHVERWLLLDSHAFKAVFGRGCRAPDQKCLKDRYKDALRDSIRTADPGLNPPLGGLEYAADLIEAMDIQACREIEESLNKFVAELEGALRLLSHRT